MQHISGAEVRRLWMYNFDRHAVHNLHCECVGDVSVSQHVHPEYTAAGFTKSQEEDVASRGNT